MRIVEAHCAEQFGIKGVQRPFDPNIMSICLENGRGGSIMSIIIIPAYKPSEVLAKITDELWTYGCQMIVVDDGSGEEYRPIFDKIKDICIVLRHSENRGKGAAIKTALSYIKKEMWNVDLIGIMDADGQHLPKDMIKLLEFAKTHREALVLGVRAVGKEMPLKSRLGNQITRMVFKLISGVNISDTQTGLRAFRWELLEKLLPVEGERYEYEMNVLMMCAKTKIPIEEVPIHTIYQDRKNSTSHFRSIRDSARIYKNILKFTLSSFSSFILDYVLFSLLLFFFPHTALSIFIANIVARVFSAFYNYTMNYRFVFGTNKKISTATYYFILAGAILVMNNFILGIFVQMIHMPVHLAKVLTEFLLFLFSWLIQNYMIFRKERIYILASNRKANI